LVCFGASGVEADLGLVCFGASEVDADLGLVCFGASEEAGLDFAGAGPGALPFGLPPPLVLPSPCFSKKDSQALSTLEGSFW
jgi:hypothetical protein